ncbi:hypothetical protein [Muribacter muris]|uniref:hypothetical protein n=1 Tax=Muribacter muris TaxID=67855 RepID=UPI0038992F06
MFKDAGNQSMWWSGFSGVLAWLGDQQNLMVLSLAIGIITALVNMYDKCKQGKARERAEEREPSPTLSKPRAKSLMMHQCWKATSTGV